MDIITVAGGILALILVIVGPGSGMWFIYRRSFNEAVEDIAEIKAELRAQGERFQADRVALARGLDNISTNQKEIERLRQTVHHHASVITGIRVRCDLLHGRTGTDPESDG